MAIQQGTYRTRGGRQAAVLCVDAPGIWPAIGYIIGPDGDTSHPRGWMLDGRSFYSTEHPDDLIIIQRSPTVTIIEDDGAEE